MGNVRFQVPVWFVPASVTIVPAKTLTGGSGDHPGYRLFAPPVGRLSPFPPAGRWKSFAESDLTDHARVSAIAERFGSLTQLGAGEEGEVEGEPLSLWNRLVDDLRPLAAAWADDGSVATGSRAHKAHEAAESLQKDVLFRHRADDPAGRAGCGGWTIGAANEWAFVCTDMAEYWRLDAIS